MRILLRDDLVEAVKIKELKFRQLLVHPKIRSIKSRGLMIAVEFDSFDENKSIKPLKVFDQARIDEIQRTMQIRHLYTHQNGIVDDKFRQYFPLAKVNDEYPMTLDAFLKRFEYLADAIEAVDNEARKVFNLALYS